EPEAVDMEHEMTPVSVFFSAQIPIADFQRPLCQQLQVGTKLRTDETVALGFGIGKTTVQRYIRLTELIPPILQMVDEGQINKK
ncbi:hypothetical protein B5F35_06110, partial [Anaeromassilibacillus sp. An200]